MFSDVNRNDARNNIVPNPISLAADDESLIENDQCITPVQYDGVFKDSAMIFLMLKTHSYCQEEDVLHSINLENTLHALSNITTEDNSVDTHTTKILTNKMKIYNGT